MSTDHFPSRFTLAGRLRAWIQDPSKILVQEFIIYEAQMSKEEFELLCESDEELKSAYDFAMTVQEYKIQVGGLTGQLNPGVCVKLLETFHSWAKDPATQVNVFQRAAQEAAQRASKIEAEGSRPAITSKEDENEEKATD